MPAYITDLSRTWRGIYCVIWTDFPLFFLRCCCCLWKSNIPHNACLLLVFALSPVLKPSLLGLIIFLSFLTNYSVIRHSLVLSFAQTRFALFDYASTLSISVVLFPHVFSDIISPLYSFSLSDFGLNFVSPFPLSALAFSRMAYHVVAYTMALSII